jgi:hypothetical protein
VADILMATGVLIVITLGLGSAVSSARPAAPDHVSYLRAFERPQTSRDALPADFPVGTHGAGGLIASSSRFLGAIDTTSSYWVVQDRLGNLCLVLNDAVRRMTGAGCGEAADLENGSISVSISQGPDGGYQAFLIADRFASADATSPWIRGGPNLIAIPLDAAPTPLVVGSDVGGEAIQLEPFPISR